MELGKANPLLVHPSDLLAFSTFNYPQVLLTDDGDNYGDEKPTSKVERYPAHGGANLRRRHSQLELLAIPRRI